MPNDYISVSKFRFETSKQASIVAACLSVDDELQPEKVTKEIHVEDNILVIKFTATDAKLLRVVMSSFMDMLQVAVKTLMEFETDVN